MTNHDKQNPVTNKIISNGLFVHEGRSKISKPRLERAEHFCYGNTQ